ncbi:MAG: ATP-binding protein [Bdellovibrionales bacterium]|nr:ATP-binding protein [Bdellovibrionales bacterium]
MKDRFWIYLAGFVGACFLIVAVGGLYVLTLQESQTAKAQEKKALFRQSAFYLKELKTTRLKLRKEAEKSLETANKKESSLFAALAFVDLKSRSVEPVFSPTFDKTPGSISKGLFREFLKFADTTLNQKTADKSFFHFLSHSEENEKWMVFVTPLQDLPKSRGLFWAGLIKRKDFFHFSKASDREALIINSQGRLFFSFQPKPAIFPSKSVLKKFLKKSKQKKKTGWYVKRLGGFQQGSNLFHIRPWPGTNLFVMSGGKFFQPLFAWTDSSALWLFFCFSLGIILLLGLVLFIKPLHSAYETVREELIHLARTGEKPSLPKSRNPYLSFSGSLQFSEDTPPSSPLARKEEQPPPVQTLRDILNDEEKELKRKFPGFNLTACLDADINLGYFYKSMKKALHELLLNAIEAMGSVENQNITVTSREEKDCFLVAVRDYGVGLKEKERKKAFNLYYSTKSHLGVGLNLVQSIVSSHGGTVKLISPEDGGLEVQISLPLKWFSTALGPSPASFRETPLRESEQLKSSSSQTLH